MAAKPSSSSMTPVTAASAPPSSTMPSAAASALVAAASAPSSSTVSSAAPAAAASALVAAANAPSSSTTSSAAAAASALEAGEEEISLVVSWCGSKYLVKVARTGAVGDLKARIFDATGLPIKRQMLTLRCPNVDLVLKEEAVLLSSLPLNPSSELRVIGMKPMHPQPYSKLYWKHKKLVRGVIVITDTRERLHDFHGRKTNLYVGHYKAQFLKIDCCIKKAIKEDPISLSSYTLMKRFRHPNAVTIESIYWEGNQARLLLSTVDGSFEGWVLKHGCNILFNAAWDGTTLSEVYRSMIIDLCKVLEKLIKDGICPIRICAKNLYIKLIHGVPKLKVLMDDVECVEKDESLKAKQVKNFWHGVTQMITSSLERSHFPPFNINTAGFCNFIGKDSANKLEAYPDRWSYQEKGAYLLTIVSADREKIRPLIKSSGVVWATKGTGELRTKLNQIIVDHKTDNIFYNLSVPYDYIRLCRNSFKRFNILSPELQGAFGTNEGILQKMEKWDPEIWLKLFEAIGLPA